MARVPYVGVPEVSPSYEAGRLPYYELDAAAGAVGAASALVGRQLSEVGTALTKAAEIYQGHLDTLDEFNANKALHQFNEAEQERLMRSVREAPNTAENFTRDFMTEYDRRSRAVLQTIAPKYRPQSEIRLQRLRGGYSSKALEFEFKQRDVYYTGEITRQTEVAASGALNVPESVDTRIAGIAKTIETSGLPPVNKAQLLQKSTTDIADAAINGLITQGRTEEARALRNRFYGTVPAPLPGPIPTGAVPGQRGYAPGYIVPRADVEAYIRRSAAARRVDPNTAVRVYQSEGASNWSSQVPTATGTEQSFGPFQLYTGGGLGNTFQRETGLNPRDPRTWRENIDFALDQVVKGGWGPWSGARKIGVTGFQGVAEDARPQGTGSGNVPYLVFEGGNEVKVVSVPAVMPSVNKAVYWENQISGYAYKVQQAAEKAAKEEQKALGDEYGREIFSRADPNRPEGVPPLTREYVEEARPYLTPSEYKGALGLLAPTEETAVDHPDAIVDLTAKMDVADPNEFLKDATAYLREGKLKPSTFRTMVGQNRTARRDDMPASPYRAGREFVRTALDPGFINDAGANAVARAAQARALTEFDTWSRANPKATHEEALRQADAITREHQLVSFNVTRQTLGKSKYFVSKTIQEITIEDVNSARKTLFEEMEAGRISDAESVFELKRLNDWRSVLNWEEQQKERGRGRTPSTR